MQVTAQQVLGQISQIEKALRHGLQTGNIKAVMKEQKLALRTLFSWQQEELGEDLKAAFGVKSFLWGFTIAWGNSNKAGDKTFMEDQLRAMKKFDEKNGFVGTAGDLAPGAGTGAAAGPSSVGSRGLGADVGVAAKGTEVVRGVGVAARGVGVAVSPQRAGAALEGAGAGAAMGSGTAMGAGAAMGAAMAPVHVESERRTSKAPAKPSGSRRQAQPRRQNVSPSSSPTPTTAPARPSKSGRSREVQSSSGSSIEDFETDEESETTESDVDGVVEEKEQRQRSRNLKCGKERLTSCIRCSRLGRTCYDQVNGKKACFVCGKAKVKCETQGDFPGDRPRGGKVAARKNVKKAGSSRRFTREEKGKSKATYYSDVEMDDVAHEPPSSPAPDIRQLQERLRKLEHQLYDQGRWIRRNKATVVADLHEINHSLADLTDRMDEFEEYMGIRPQPILLFDRPAQIHYMIEDPTSPEEDARGATTAPAGLQEDGRGAAPAPLEENGHVATAAVSGDNGHGAATAPAAFQEEAAPVNFGDNGIAAAPVVATPVMAAPVVAAPVVAAPVVAASIHVSSSPTDADAESSPAGPQIKVVPPTPQDSQELVQRTTSLDALIPPLLQPPSIPDANPVELATASNSSGFVPPPTPPPRASHSPHPSPPPQQLRRSHRLASPALPSRSTTPQPNPKKRAGTSEDREEVKRGRKN